jgi:multiple sugar transport system permease protein/putative aldouronate transport system permease protein
VAVRKSRAPSGRGSLFTILVYLVVLLFALVCFFPFYLILINSFVDNKVLNQEGYQLYVKSFSLESYKYLFQGSQAYIS